MKQFLLATSISLASAIIAEAGGHCQSLRWTQDWDAGSYWSVDVFAYAYQRTGISIPILFAIFEQESRAGRNTGSSGAGIADANPSRDGALFWVIAEQFGLNPRTACASRRPDHGWGGAIGIMQVLPSTFAQLNGYTVRKSKKLFSSKIRRGRLVTTGQDVQIVQWYLNEKMGYQLKVDGVFGKRTRRALIALQERAGFRGTRCQKEIGRIGGCTRSFITASARMIAVSYDPRRDKVRKFFGLSERVNPWSFSGGIYTAAYYLKKMYDRGVSRGYSHQKALRFAIGAYYAGPGGAWGRYGKRYTASVLKEARSNHAYLTDSSRYGFFRGLLVAKSRPVDALNLNY